MTRREASDWREKAEFRNDGYFTHFNNKVRFFNVKRNEKYSTLDYYGTDRKGRPVNIETKVRECDINTYNTLFIENKKWQALKEGYENGIKPIYINFMRDGNHVFLIDLTQYFNGLKHIDTKFVDVSNYGYQREDNQVLRYLIPPRDGVFYELNPATDKYDRKW